MSRIPATTGGEELRLTTSKPSPARLIDSPAAFAQVIAEVKQHPVLALDTESDSLYRYFYRVCVIQLSTPQADYILDPLSLPDLSPLGELMADPAVEKIFHAAENDVLVLKRDFGFEFANVFDTMLAARILGWRQVGLAALLSQHFGVELNKHAQLTDWGRRPLTLEQLSYAHLDSHYLLPLRERLCAELQARGRWREALETFAALPRITYTEKPFDPDGFWRSKGARDLEPRELAILRELYLWRDTRARAQNLPPFKIIDDRCLAQISTQQPQRAGELHLSPYQVNHYGEDIIAAVQRGRNAAPPSPPSRPHNDGLRPDPETVARYDRLRAWRAQQAIERDVENDVILTNDLLMAIARAHPATVDELAALNVLGPWKLETYGAEIVRAARP
jgi:ribonuclease D